MRRCSYCGRIFFTKDSRSSLCNERCRKASKKAARQGFEDRTKGQNYEQAYSREYMFWYKRNHAPQKQIDTAETALKQFSQEALQRKKQVKHGEESATQFIHWMIGQEVIIQEICEKGYE